MYKVIIISLVITLLTGCATSKSSPWLVYCKKYQINQSWPTEDQVDYFYDCYFGSTEYEKDLANY